MAIGSVSTRTMVSLNFSSMNASVSRLFDRYGKSIWRRSMKGTLGLSLRNCRTVQSQALSIDDRPDNQDSRCLKETFVYTDSVKIEDEQKQACYITKSVLKPGIPTIYDRPLDLNETVLQNIMEKFEEQLKDSMLFCYGEEDVYRKRGSVVNTFLNMLQTTWKETTRSYPSNFQKSVFYKQHVSAAINRCNEFSVQVAGKPKRSFLMMSKQPLKQFATNDEISISKNEEMQWDEVYSPVFNFRKEEMYAKVLPPFLANAPFPNPHTLFITPDKRQPEMKRFIGHGLMYTFAHAFSHALSKPGNFLGMKEIEPVCMQCVINNGQALAFICYQLNTLDFETNSGVKNFVWIDDNMKMFQNACLKIPGDKRYKNITETEICLEGVNHESLHKFLKFVLN